MIIIKLKAENIKRIKAVEIKPDGELVVVSGRNGQGKTSVLDAIWLALAGGDAGKAVKNPIRKGARTASAMLDLGEFSVKRTWRLNDNGGATTKLEVLSADGAAFKRPQNKLDALLGSLSFDPLAFSRLSDGQQVEALLNATGNRQALEEIDGKRDAMYSQRRDVNRDMKSAQGARDRFAADVMDAPDEAVQSVDILDRIETAQQLRKGNEKLDGEEYHISQEVTHYENEVEYVERQIDELKNRLKDKIIALDKEKTKYEKIRLTPRANIPDIDDLRAELATVEATNTRVRDKQAAQECEANRDKLKAKSTSLTKSIQFQDAEKASILEGAQLPIDGVGFDKDGLTYQGQAFADCSGAERLQVSVAIAMALNPELRVLRITDGSLLDTENLQVLADMAAAHDFQIWIERVEEDDDAIIIEDGTVRDA